MYVTMNSLAAQGGCGSLVGGIGEVNGDAPDGDAPGGEVPRLKVQDSSE